MSPEFIEHLIHWNAEAIGHELAERCFESLSYRHRSGAQNQRAILGETQAGLVFRRAQEWTAGDLDTVAQADAAELTARFGVGATGGETVEFGDLGGLLHVAFEFAAVVGEGEGGLVGHCLGRDQVATAQFVRADAEFPRGDVDDALDRVGRFGTARASIGGGGHSVGQDAARLSVDCGDLVDAGGAADVADRPTGAAGHVGTEIHVPAQFQRGEFVLGIQRQFDCDAHLARLLIGQEAFGAIGNPSHRALHFARGPRDQGVFRLHA